MEEKNGVEKRTVLFKISLSKPEMRNLFFLQMSIALQTCAKTILAVFIPTCSSDSFF